MQLLQKAREFVIVQAFVPILAEEVLNQSTIFHQLTNLTSKAQTIPVGSSLPIIGPHQCHHFLKLIFINFPVETQYQMIMRIKLIKSLPNLFIPLLTTEKIGHVHKVSQQCSTNTSVERHHSVKPIRNCTTHNFNRFRKESSLNGVQ